MIATKITHVPGAAPAPERRIHSSRPTKIMSGYAADKEHQCLNRIYSNVIS